MKAAPTNLTPPWSYAESQVLDPPAERPTIASIARRISKFKREGWVDIGSRLLWYMWQRDFDENEANIVTRACAAPIIALGCIFGGPLHLPRPTELEFRLLCWELHNSPEPPNRNSAEARVAMLVVRHHQRQLAADHPLRRIQQDDLRRVWLEYRLGLLAQAQLRPTVFVQSDLVRPLLVYEKFREARRGQHLDNLRALERTFFGLAWDGFVRSFVVAAAVGNADALADIGPGRIDIDDSGVADQAENVPLGVTPADLKIFMTRMGTRITDFAKHGAELLALPTHAAKYHSTVRQLETRPVILLDDHPGTFPVCIPSPLHVRGAIEAYLLDEFFGFAKAHEKTHPLGADAWSARGQAFHEHLADTLAESNVTSLDTGVSAHNQSKRPDFLWVGHEYGVMIEAKIRLGPNGDPWGRDPMSIWESWRRGVEAIEQAAAFLQRGCDGLAAPVPKHWVLAIVTMQPMAAESSSLRTAAKRFDLLAGTAIEAVAVVSPAELEHFALLRDADAYGSHVHELWNQLDADSLDRSDEGVRVDKPRVSRVVRNAWERFLPDLSLPWP